jgi:protein-export membrane protein SecD
MSSSWKLKSFALVLGIFLAIYFLLPTLLGVKEKRIALEKSGDAIPWYFNVLPNKELNLGLDLRGGLYLELNVGIDEALVHQIDFVAGDIKRLADDKTTEVVQLKNHKLRVESTQDKQGDLRKELVRYFGNQVFDFTKDMAEVYFSFNGDAEKARKAALSVMKAEFGEEVQVQLTHGKKYLAIGFDSLLEQKQIQDLFVANESFTQEAAMADAFYLTFKEEYVSLLRKNIIEQAANSVRNRIDRFGVAEASVSRQSGDRLVIELPGVKDSNYIIDIVKRTGKLTFQIVDRSKSTAELNDYIETQKEKLGIKLAYQKDNLTEINKALADELPQGTEIAFRLERHPDTKKVIKAIPFLLMKKAEVTGDMLENASVQSQNNMPYVSMSFSKAGAKKFGQLTSNNIGELLAIVLDGVVMSAPNIKTAITGGQAQIELGFGRFEDLQREARELVLILKEGALPATLTVATKNVIGPSLGKDSIAVGMKSLMIAAIAVLAFMLLYYRVGGIVANIALVMNVIFIFAILTLFQASLTLPGIAGIVLTLGMAVDANVIIFERMREEKFLGKNPTLIVDNGFSNAMSAIIDGNITTFIAGLVLFEFGTGPIKGFATTLMIGIVTSLITAIILTRVIYDFMIKKFKLQKLWI